MSFGKTLVSVSAEAILRTATFAAMSLVNEKVDLNIETEKDIPYLELVEIVLPLAATWVVGTVVERTVVNAIKKH